ncbi:Phosphatidylinositol 4-kinase gamma 4 [Diplonema papillatum]|nr:Phosphatidylinositol 4-kinase gamma 4 [Diplonema papillatum]|eukprot:gene19547-30111_t
MFAKSQLASETRLRAMLRGIWDEKACWAHDSDEDTSDAPPAKGGAWVPRRLRQGVGAAVRDTVRATMLAPASEADADECDESEQGMTNETRSKVTASPECLPLFSDSVKSEAASCPEDVLDATQPSAAPSTLEQEIEAAISQRSLVVEASSEDNVSGAFFLKHAGAAAAFAVAKPSNREVACAKNTSGYNDRKEGFVPGSGCLREAFAYAIDQQNFAGVPETVVMDLPESLFDASEPAGARVACSVQRFVPNDGQSWDCGPASFSAEHTRRIGLLDLRLLNCDRHGGNVLMRKTAAGTTGLVPIDHGFVMPTCITDLMFEWENWKQADTPFTEEELAYVRAIDVDADAELAEEMGIEGEAVDCFRAAQICLKVGCEKGLNLRQLAGFFRRQRVNEPSGLELLVSESRFPLDHRSAGTIDFAHLATRVEQVISGNWREALH